MYIELSPRSTVAGAFAVTTLLAFLIPTASPVNAMSLEELQVSAKKDGKLYIYTANVDAIMKVIVPAFEKEFPYVKVSWIRLPSTTVFNRFTAENDSGVAQADLLWTASSQLYQEKPGLFRELDSATVPNMAIPTTLKTKNSSYVISSVITHNVTYNTDLVSQADLKAHLATWEGLSDPRWAGHTALVDPRGSASVSSLFHLLGETYGSAWLAAVGKQVTLIDRGSSGAQQVAAGAFQIAVPTDNSHSADIRAKGAPVATWIPGGPAHGLENSMAIPKNSGHPAAAALFVNWALSPSGQTVLCGLDTAVARPADAKCERVPATHASPRDSVPDEMQAKMIKQLGLAP
jgi:iron(III) transport system substrate-binding protein